MNILTILSALDKTDLEIACQDSPSPKITRRLRLRKRLLQAMHEQISLLQSCLVEEDYRTLTDLAILRKALLQDPVTRQPCHVCQIVRADPHYGPNLIVVENAVSHKLYAHHVFTNPARAASS